MKGCFTLLFVAVHGLLLWEESIAFGTDKSHTTLTIRRRGRHGIHSTSTVLPFSKDYRHLRIILPIHLHGESSAAIASRSRVVRTSALVNDIVPRGGYAAVRTSVSSINAFFKYYPFLASFLICAFKASSADFFAQYMSFKKSLVVSIQENGISDIDKIGSSSSSQLKRFRFHLKRNLALLCYGGLYQGCGQHLIYNDLFSTLFGARTHLKTALIKVSFDMLLIQPFVSLPVAYLIKAN